MHITIRSLSLLSAILLVGCSTIQHSQTFRNRTMDYSHEDVAELPTLQTPAGLPTPSFAPALTIPPGQLDYPPGQPGNLKPPTFNDVVVIPALPPKSPTSTSNS